MRFDFDEGLGGGDLYDDEPPGWQSQAPRMGWVVFVSILVAAGTTALLYLSSQGAGGGSSGGSSDVPAVVGLSEAEARRSAEAAKLTIQVQERVSDAVVAAGSVAWQQPLAGERVPAGSAIRVKISSGLPGAGSAGGATPKSGGGPDARRRRRR